MNPHQLLGDVLKAAQRFAATPREKSLFGLGGRGYYENPASDLLAFFLSPDAEHELGNMFLHTFLVLLVGEERAKSLGSEGVTVHREVQTKEGDRIDLMLTGRNWVLLIENKIFAGQNNPFDRYRAHGTGLRDTLLLAILSPDGKSVHGDWRGLSYRDYCTALRGALAQVLFTREYSKWVVFAREFILHLENELYQPNTVMTEEEADFVEAHTQAIAQLKAMDGNYRGFLQALMRDRVNQTLNTEEVKIKDEGWAIRCFHQDWGRSNLAFSIPSKLMGRKFQVTVYLVDLNDTQEAAARAAFGNLRLWTEGKWLCWRTEPGFDSRQENISELCRLASEVSKLFPPTKTPTVPEKENDGAQPQPALLPA